MNGLMITGKWYDRLKYFVLIVMPAISSLYFGLGNIFDWGNVEEVIGSLAVIATFLGTVLGVSSKNFNTNEKFVGETWLAPTDGGWKRVFNVTADEIDPDRKEISFKVVDSQAP